MVRLVTDSQHRRQHGNFRWFSILCGFALILANGNTLFAQVPYIPWGTKKSAGFSEVPSESYHLQRPSETNQQVNPPRNSPNNVQIAPPVNRRGEQAGEFVPSAPNIIQTNFQGSGSRSYISPGLQPSSQNEGYVPEEGDGFDVFNPMPPEGTTQMDQMPVDENGNYFDPNSMAPAMNQFGFPNSSECCASCPSFYYGRVEALYTQRDSDENISVGPFLSIDGSEGTLGYRVTVGHQWDCLEGFEMVYSNYGEWEASNTQVSPGGGIDSNFFGFGVFFPDDFLNASRQDIVWESTFNNLEINRRQWGWDIVSAVWGIRLMNLKEKLFVFSTDADPGFETGMYRQDVDNLMMGVHGGGDLLFPITQNLYWGTKSKVGLFLNYINVDTLVVNNGVTLVDNSVDEMTWSIFSELGTYLSYRLGPKAQVHAGFEMAYLYGVTTAANTVWFNIDERTGTAFDTSQHIWLSSANVGFELFW